jgi:hypothetical protein
VRTRTIGRCTDTLRFVLKVDKLRESVDCALGRLVAGRARAGEVGGNRGQPEGVAL